MAFTFPAMVAWDPNGKLAVKNVSFQVFATTDTAFTSPLPITDPFGTALPGNILNSGSQGVFPQFQQASNSTVVIADSTKTYAWTVVSVSNDATTASFINTAGSATTAALNATSILKWKPSTAYTSGQQVITPAGDVASAISNFTSGATFNPASWNYVRMVDLFANVKAFGATGAGGVDDTAAIHAARDAANSSGQAVYFPPGTYTTATGIQANKASQTWVISPGATIQPSSGSTNCIFVVTANSVTINGGGTLDGSTTTSPNSAGIFTYSGTNTPVDDLTIENVRIQNTGGYGIQTLGNRARVRNCRIYNTASTGINMGPTSTTDVADCEISGNIIDRSGVSAATSYGNIFVAGTASAAQKIKGTIIRGNTLVMIANPTHVAGAMIGIECQRGAQHTSVVGNRTFNGAMGISIAGQSDHVTAVGNTIFGPTWYGIEIADSSYCSVTGNTIDGNGVLGTGASSSTYGIVINYTTWTPNYNTVVGNNVMGLAAGASNSSAGVAVAGGGGAGHVISDNTLTVAVHGITISASNDQVITNNKIYGTAASGSNGVWLNGTAGSSVVANNHVKNIANGINLTATSGVMDNIAMGDNVFTLVTTPLQTVLSGGATLGPNVRWTGNAGSGAPNTEVGGSFVSNYFYGPQHGSYGTAAPPLNLLTAHPFIVSRGSGLTISQVGITVTTAAASSSLRVGIYADSNGLPGSLIQEFTSGGVIDTSTTGDKSITLGTNLALQPGRYWVATVAQGASATVPISTGVSPHVGRLTIGGSNGHATAYTVSGVTGTLPSTFGAPGGTNYAINAVLRSA